MIRARNFKLCVIVPCYNEDENLLPFYKVLLETVDKYNYTIIFINDGSSDDTLGILQSLSIANDRVNYLSLSRNFGHQNALKAGYDYAKGDCVVCIDADLQQPPHIIDNLIEKWQYGYDVVNTIRKDGAITSSFKKYTAKLFYRLLNYISKIELPPNSADFRLVDAKVLKVIQQFNEESIFIRGLIVWAGFKQFAIDYTVERRLHGESKYSLKKMISLSITGLTGFSISPLRLASVIGCMFSLFSFIYGIYAIIVHFTGNTTVPGWTSLIVSFLFITGLQFILIGIIGEYLGKSFMEAKKRPNYLVSDENINSINHMHERSILAHHSSFNIIS